MHSTSILAPTTVNAGAGNDTITVGFKSSVAGILGPLTVNGQAGFDALVIDDRADGPDTFVIDGLARRVWRNGRILLDYLNIESITILD